jgi:hypothetical protein
MIYHGTHDKMIADKDSADFIDQLNYRYKDGDLMITSPMAVFSFQRETASVGDIEHWKRVDMPWEPHTFYKTKEYQDKLALIVYYGIYGDENTLGSADPEVDYIYTKSGSIYLGKSRTAKLRLRVKPAKVERREEEE